MNTFKQIHQITTKLIKQNGSEGKILRTISPTTGARNSYDENGEEIVVTDTGTVQEYIVQYVHKRLKDKELRSGSFNDEYTRFTTLSQNALGEDEHRENILKADVFIDCMGVKYSIEQIDHVGQMQGKEMILEIIAQRG